MDKIKKYALVIAATAAFALFAAQTVVAAPIPIPSANELVLIGVDPGYPLNGSYELTGDINYLVTNTGFTRGDFIPIGTYEKPFTGTFDGKGHYISYLTVRRPDDGYVGLFGHIGKGGVVRGVGLHYPNITGHFAAGAIAGGNDGTVENSYVLGGTVHVERLESNAGGLAGVNGGTISGCYSTANVTGKENVGGLVGLLVPVADGAIINSYASGEVTGTGRVGGLAGYTFGGTIRNCFSAGRVTGARLAGGLVGADYAGTAGGYRNIGTVSAGGGTRYVERAAVINSFWDEWASAQSASAGGTGKNTEEMARQSTFAGWDFDAKWILPAAGGYPVIRGVPVNRIIYMVIGGVGGYIRVDDGREDLVRSQHTAFTAEGEPGPYVIAVAHSNYQFVRWSDGGTEPRRRDIAAADSIVFIAELKINTCTIEYTAGAGGSLRVGSNGETHQTFSTDVDYDRHGPQITAVPDNGYRFIGWSDGGTTAARSDIARIDTAFTALFALESAYAFRYVAGSNGMLQVGTSPTPVSTHIAVVDGGASGPQITAVPNSGYRFNGWSDGVADAARTDAAAARDINVTADFVYDTIRISTFEELCLIGKDARYPLDREYALTGNIDASASRTMNGGAGFEPIGRFAGKFYGRGYTISGLYINRPNAVSIGFFASVDNNALVEGVNLAEVDIRGGGLTGGLAGGNNGGTIRNCSVKGNVSVTGGATTGGLVGANGGTISDSYSAGSVSHSHTDYSNVGGLVGINYAYITRCYSTAAVSSTGDPPNTINSIGGLVGSNQWEIAQSFSTGSVRRNGAYSFVGGLVGSSGVAGFDVPVSITECYSIGAVTNNMAGRAGGFAARIYGSDTLATFARSYWNITTSGQSTSEGGDGVMGRTTAQMREQSTYEDWDFTNVWVINPSQNNGYPYLRSLGVPVLAKRPELSESSRDNSAAVVLASPRATVRGRTLVVTAPENSDLQIKLFNLKGRTVARYNINVATGTGRFSLAGVPAGKYIVELRDGGGKKLVSRSAFVLK